MNLVFHHVGVACRDLEAETVNLARLGYVARAPDFTDPIQGVRGRFLEGGGPVLELLMPFGEGGPLAPWLKAGVKLYHLAYETPDLEGSIREFQRNNAKLLWGPAEANGVGNRRIAFLMLPNLLLTELISAI